MLRALAVLRTKLCLPRSCFVPRWPLGAVAPSSNWPQTQRWGGTEGACPRGHLSASSTGHWPCPSGLLAASPPGAQAPWPSASSQRRLSALPHLPSWSRLSAPRAHTSQATAAELISKDRVVPQGGPSFPNLLARHLGCRCAEREGWDLVGLAGHLREPWGLTAGVSTQLRGLVPPASLGDWAPGPPQLG